MLKRNIRVQFILFVMLTALLCGAELQAKTLPDFWIRNLAGKRFDTRKQAKKTYVISFFYVNCIPCIKEIPQLYKLISEEFPKVPLLFIDPIREDGRKDIRRFAKKLKVPESYFYKDSFGSVSKNFFAGQFAFPTIIGVRNDKQRFRYSGITPEIIEEIREKLK